LAIRLKQVRVRSGDRIAFVEGITVIVGPNNVGKSLLLKEINEVLSDSHGSPLSRTKMLSELTLEPNDEFGPLIDWMRETAPLRPPGDYPQGKVTEYHYVVGYNTISESSVGYVDIRSGRLGTVAPALVLYLPTDDRLRLVGFESSFHRVREMPSTPMHYLFADRNREAQLSEYCVRAFGDPLTVHRYGGSQITLHLGRPSLPEPLPPQNADYVAELDQLPLVSEQGDGLRAFIGMLLATGTREYPLILIDEPEAFLHPPQARILGRLLVEISTSRGQVIISTHSDDIVQGILSAQATREVSVVRLTRSGSNMNRVSQLQPKAVRELYEDQLLRYSRVLDGLFYSGVVLCEAEADCRFYGAIFDVLREQEGFEHFRRLDLHFTHCGGKDRIHRAVAALRAVRVPVACATDIDILQDHGKLDQLVQSLGGDLAHLRSKINILHSAITAKNQPVKRGVAQHAIGEILAESASPNIAPDEAARIRALLQERSG
jgi:energy-coupling factor transporter ATP-binding protein EcfA2